MAKSYKMIRVQESTGAKLAALKAKYVKAYEECKMDAFWPGDALTDDALILHLIRRLDGHRRRAKKARAKKASASVRASQSESIQTRQT